MSNSRPAHQIEFIKLDGHAVRVTSWRPGDEPRTFNLVTITRGSRDAGLLDELLSQASLDLQVGDAEAMTVSARDIDRRTVGEGQSGITRFSVVLVEGDAAKGVVADAPNPSLADRVATLEAEVTQLRELVHNLTGHGR
ncbi:MAG: hypothetical protein M3457_15720 [Chloroflexota bacterium]|nr:hypothetical protein [Chloroflexota bacterium]